MGRTKWAVPIVLCLAAAVIVSGCETFSVSDDINGLIKKNSLSISMKAQENPDGFTTEKVFDNGDGYYLKINVTDTYSLRGESAIEPGTKIKLSVVLKNTGADPVISYSFWKKPKTSLRHFTFKGQNTNPPVSETQQIYDEWTTFEETFEAHEGEDSFMFTLHCGKGTFYIREINFELVP